MAFVYLWRATNCSPNDAAHRFSAAIDRQSTLYEEAFGHKVEQHIHQIQSLFIGQIAFETGVKGWQPWQQAEHTGIAWSGVCEAMLAGRLSPSALQQTIDDVASNPKRVVRWDGRFALCAWDDGAERVTLTTGVADSPTLWYADGPNGWAAGSRALPLLELVGRDPKIDLPAAGLFVAYGYLAGTTALFEGVNRLHARQHVVMTPQQTSVHTYLPLSEFLQTDEQPQQWEELVKQQSERLLTRVRHQIDHSTNPQLLLTGGRDSRSIVAAAVANGYTGTARTSGPSGSGDVKIAAQVCAALGIPHERDSMRSSQSPIRVLLDSKEGMKLWMQTTEGMQTIRHAIPFQAFFTRTLPYPARREQLFHGLHGLGGDSMRSGFLEKDGYDPNAPANPRLVRSIIMAQIPRQLKVYDQASDRLASVFEALDIDRAPTSVSFANWFHLFYWQNRALQWGIDGMAVKDVVSWHWAPLLDAELIQACVGLKQHDGAAKKLFEDITVTLAPALHSVVYDKRAPTLTSRAKNGVKWAIKQAQRHGISIPFVTLGKNATIPVDQELLQFWEEIFFSTTDHIWRELVDEAFVRQTIQTRPSSELLWSLATVELTARATLSLRERTV